MSKIKSAKSVETTVIMSRMDYEIAVLVYKRLIAIGFTDEEVSFLLGKRNKYVFDLINPTEKDKFKTEQLDVLPTILQCTIRQLIPNNVQAGEQIRIRGSKRASSTKILYRHTVAYPDGTEQAELVWEKKLLKSGRKQVNGTLHLAVLKLVNAGYFKTARNALEIYLTLKAKKHLTFTPADLQKSLAVLMNRKRQEPPVLECAIENARYFYKNLVL